MLNDHLQYWQGPNEEERGGGSEVVPRNAVLAGKRWSYWSYAVVGSPGGG